MPDDALERLAKVFDEADAAREADLAELEGLDLDQLHEFVDQPDPDTDGKEHD